MAKPPSKRRGIALGPRADTAANLVDLTAAPQAGPTGSARGQEPALPELYGRIERMRAELETRRQREEAQWRQLEEQRGQLARQAEQLRALERTRGGGGRVAALLAVLALVGVAALGYQVWPRLQDVAGGLDRVSGGVDRIGPQLQAVRGEMSSLRSRVSVVGNSVDSLQRDVSGVRSDLGTLHKTVDTLPATPPLQASAGNVRPAAQVMPRDASTAGDPYRGMRPMMPW